MAAPLPVGLLLLLLILLTLLLLVVELLVLLVVTGDAVLPACSRSKVPAAAAVATGVAVVDSPPSGSGVGLTAISPVALRMRRSWRKSKGR